jgi:hypothetical protein
MGDITLSHINSHQSTNNATQILQQLDIEGNNIADAQAKEGRISNRIWNIPIQWGMGPFILQGPINGHAFFPIYTDIRDYILQREKSTMLNEWYDPSRKSRSEILTTFSLSQRGYITSLISSVNKCKDSTLIGLLLGGLTKSLPSRNALFHRPDNICKRCNDGTVEDTLHIFTCISTTHLKLHLLQQLGFYLEIQKHHPILMSLQHYLLNPPQETDFHIIPLLLGNLPTVINDVLESSKKPSVQRMLQNLAR